VVEETGEGTDPALRGARVVSETYFYTCGVCNYCKVGRYNLCLQRRSIGSLADGCFAEYIVVPARNIHMIPETVSFEEAAFTEPLACCCQAVLEKANPIPQDTAIITGPGTIGLLVLQIVKAAGTRCIMVGTEADKDRLELAKRLGADIVYPAQEGLAEKIIAECGMTGAQNAFECSGAGSAMNLCIDCLQKGGAMVQMGIATRDTPVNMNAVTLKELTILGSFAQKWLWWEKALKLLEQGTVRVNELISEKLPLEQWEHGFEASIAGKGLKYLLIP
jgi:L-iditol 2-dehydrogenase